jgi:arsenite methyltransferase
MNPTREAPLDVLQSVRSRYAAGAERQVPELCCPVSYDTSLLEALPPEIIERDYGCGDPSRFVRPGDVVLDLGAGAGKICYMASQLTGPEGRVIGVDTTPEMLALSRSYQQQVGEKIGWHNTEFRHGLIQDLALDRDRLAAWLSEHPVTDAAGLDALRAEEARLRREEPLVPDESVTLVLSNCVLNLVDPADKQRMFAEIARVLAPGGRCAISDIVCDEDVPQDLQDDPELWSGCISGALREDRFVQAFVDAGLHGVEIVELQSEPWAVVRGIEFRSMTIVAWKAAEGDAVDCNEAVIYRGPWREVRGDDGQLLRRGERTAVSRATFERLGSEPYAASVHRIAPHAPVDPAEASAFSCCGAKVRDPQQSKAGALRPDVAPGTGGGCC